MKPIKHPTIKNASADDGRTIVPASDRSRSLKGQAEVRLRTLGIRVTAARVKILTELIRAPSAMAHQDLLAALPGMDRVTLYRSLECLIANGLAHRIAIGDRASRYGVGTEIEDSVYDAGLLHRHGHFECVRCARVFCLSQTGGPHPNLQKILDDLSLTLEEGFQSDDIELTIKGRCADCVR